MGINALTKPVQLEDGMTLDGFCSGAATVDNWLASRARAAKARGSAVVYVSHRAGADASAEPPAGFYTLSSASITRSGVTGGWLKRNAPDQIPVILLGMLGVDGRHQGSGLGKMLLHDASARSLAVADSIGAKALVVDPLDDEAAAFYSRYGFKLVPGLRRMYVPLRMPR
ncbi:MAG: GNAT family N-acetyltransferase [Eggerthellaceae bacterium]|nr:GNAT family N-acetyltransferase [Eggerthellaceae bacterium]